MLSGVRAKTSLLPLLALAACQFYRQAPPPACDRTSIDVEPASIDFGSVAPGDSATVAFEISQDYCGAVLVESVAVTGDPVFSLVLQDAGTGYSSSSSAVRFAPTGPGPFGGLLIVTTSSSAYQVIEVPLGGNGAP
jgi:hypothetical protein